MPPSNEQIAGALAPLIASPAASAVLSDLDGTLAEVVERPTEVAIDPRGRGALARIAGRYALAGVITGRQALEARRIVGLDQLTYIGNHGYEQLDPGAEDPRSSPALEGEEDRAAGFLAGVDADRLAAAGVELEDKAAIWALHWRAAPDRERAERTAREIAAEAEVAGLRLHRGRMVIELRPPVEIDKGTGLAAALDAYPAVRNVFYAGDDLTDTDAFAKMSAMVNAGRLDHAVGLATLSEEGPPEVAAAATFAVEGVGGLVGVLERLG